VRFAAEPQIEAWIVDGYDEIRWGLIEKALDPATQHEEEGQTGEDFCQSHDDQAIELDDRPYTFGLHARAGQPAQIGIGISPTQRPGQRGAVKIS
jgi:hypothetical protein